MVAAGLCAITAVITQVVRRPAEARVAKFTPAVAPASASTAEQA